MRYHVNPKTGNPGVCHAQAGKCPFGGDENHYPSENEARAAYEQKMAHMVVKAVSKKSAKDVEHAISTAVALLAIERPSDLNEWKGDQVSNPVVLNMGIRILMDRVDHHFSEGSETPYTSALSDLREMTQDGSLNLDQTSDLNLDQAGEQLYRTLSAGD